MKSAVRVGLFVLSLFGSSLLVAVPSSSPGFFRGTAEAAPTRPSPAPARPARPSPPAPPPPPLAMLPSIARVRVEVVRDQVLVTQEINLPRGDWKGEALDFYVAFGAPGAPNAVDAHLIAVEDGSLEIEESAVGEVIPTDRAPRRPTSAHPLLGKDTMAGVVLHLKKESLTKAFAPGGMAAIRIRTALDVPEQDATGARGLVVRLGASRGTPLTLGRIGITSRPGAPSVTRAEAHLCGSSADARALAIAVTPRPTPLDGTNAEGPIAPVLAVRHATDDLCLRFWTASP